MQYSQGKLDEAIESYHYALQKYQSYYKHGHSEIASTLSNIGTVLFFKKNYNLAINFFNKSISMYERLLGKTNIYVLLPMSNIGMAYLENDNFKEAEVVFLKTINTTSASLKLSFSRYAIPILLIGRRT